MTTHDEMPYSVIVRCRDCARPLGAVPWEDADELYLCTVCEDLVDQSPVEGWELVKLMGFPILMALLGFVVLVVWAAANPAKETNLAAVVAKAKRRKNR